MDWTGSTEDVDRAAGPVTVTSVSPFMTNLPHLDVYEAVLDTLEEVFASGLLENVLHGRLTIDT